MFQHYIVKAVMNIKSIQQRTQLPKDFSRQNCLYICLEKSVTYARVFIAGLQKTEAYIMIRLQK